jgi:uncharacterized iron-regulated protein
MKLKYFETPEAVEQILVDYKDVFEQIEDYGQQLTQGMLSTQEDFRTILNFMTGAYVSLEPLYSMAEALKLNEELKAYAQIKRDAEARGDKVVAANLEREASLTVANLRRIRAILEGYVLACEKCIITAQTQLKRRDEDSKFKPQEQV